MLSQNEFCAWYNYEIHIGYPMQFDTVRGIHGFSRVLCNQVALRNNYPVHADQLKDWNSLKGGDKTILHPTLQRKRYTAGDSDGNGSTQRGTLKITFCPLEGDVLFTDVSIEGWEERTKLEEQSSPVRTDRKEIVEQDPNKWEVQLARTLIPFWEEERQRRENSLREGKKVPNSALSWSLDRSQNVDANPRVDRLEFTNQLYKYANMILSRLRQDRSHPKPDFWDIRNIQLKYDMIKYFFGVVHDSKEEQHKGSIRRFAEYGNRRKWRDTQNREAIVGDQDDPEGQEIRWANRVAFKKDYLGSIQGKQSSMYLFSNSSDSNKVQDSHAMKVSCTFDPDDVSFRPQKRGLIPNWSLYEYQNLPNLRLIRDSAFYEM